MSPLFETIHSGVIRKETGSKLGLNLIFLDVENDTLYYENPILNLKIKFWAILLTEMVELKQKQLDRVIQRPVHSEVILEKGELRAIMERSGVPDSAVNAVITDIHELMEALFLNGISSIYYLGDSDLTFRIYEAEKHRFNDVIWTIRANKKMGHETIEVMQAKLVFQHRLGIGRTG
jgi:hypothetical protein